jgi:hypothetical protein
MFGFQFAAKNDGPEQVKNLTSLVGALIEVLTAKGVLTDSDLEKLIETEATLRKELDKEIAKALAAQREELLKARPGLAALLDLARVTDAAMVPPPPVLACAGHAGGQAHQPAASGMACQMSADVARLRLLTYRELRGIAADVSAYDSPGEALERKLASAEMDRRAPHGAQQRRRHALEVLDHHPPRGRGTMMPARSAIEACLCECVGYDTAKAMAGWPDEELYYWCGKIMVRDAAAAQALRILAGLDAELR